MQETVQSLKTKIRGAPQGLRQFIKFCIVGGFNTALDWTLATILLYHTNIPSAIAHSLVGATGLGIQPALLTVWVAKMLSSGTATCNSFFWNRRWTFRVKTRKRRKRQFLQFATVNVGGMLLNSTITTLIVRPFLPNPPRLAFLGAQATATLVVVFWNFFMNKHWTFRNVNRDEEIHV